MTNSILFQDGWSLLGEIFSTFDKRGNAIWVYARDLTKAEERRRTRKLEGRGENGLYTNFRVDKMCNKRVRLFISLKLKE